MLLQAVFLLCATLPQLPATPVTLTNAGALLEVLVPLLAKESGASLVVSEQMRPEVVAVHVEGVTLDQVLTRIAQATEGTWERSSDRWILVPDNDARESARRARRARNLQVLGEILDRRLNPKPRSPEETDEQYKARLPEPTSVAVAKLIAQVGLPALLDIPDDGRVVYSTNPTAMQRAFTPNREAIASLISKNDRRVTEYQNTALAPYNRRLEGPPAKILLTFLASSEAGDLTIFASVKIVDAHGRIVISESSFLDKDDSEHFDVVKFEREAKARRAIKDDSQKLATTALTKNYFRHLRGFQPSSEDDKELFRILSHPVEHELLSYLVGDYLIQVAKLRRLALIAHLPDSSANVAVGETATVNTFLTRMESWGGVDIKSDAGFMTAAPKDGDESRAQRLDRRATLELLKSIDGGLISLSDLSEFALKAPSRGFSDRFPMHQLSVLAPLMAQTDYVGLDLAVLKLYGSLSVAQRDALEDGRPLALSNVSPLQLSFARKLVYGDFGHVVVGGETQEDEATELLLHMGMLGSGVGVFGVRDIRQEPTELVPNGLASAFLQATVTKDVIFQTVSTDVSRRALMNSVLTPEGMMLMQRLEHELPADFARDYPDFKKFRIGHLKRMDIRLHLAPQVSIPATLYDFGVPRTNPQLTLDTLPKDVVARLAVARERVAKLNLEVGATRRVPPP